jgi:hypothetical protein
MSIALSVLQKDLILIICFIEFRVDTRRIGGGLLFGLFKVLPQNLIESETVSKCNFKTVFLSQQE